MSSTIKVDRLILLKQLEKVKAEQDALKNNYEKARKKWQDDVKAKDAKLANILVKKSKPKSVDVRKWSGEITMTYDYPPGDWENPESPDQPEGYIGYQMLEELTKTIKLLKLTTEPLVSTSVYKNLANFL